MRYDNIGMPKTEKPKKQLINATEIILFIIIIIVLYLLFRG